MDAFEQLLAYIEEKEPEKASFDESALLSNGLKSLMQAFPAYPKWMGSVDRTEHRVDFTFRVYLSGRTKPVDIICRPVIELKPETNPVRDFYDKILPKMIQEFSASLAHFCNIWEDL